MIKAVVFDIGRVLVNDPFDTIISVLKKEGISAEKAKDALYNDGWAKYKTGKSDGSGFWQAIAEKSGMKIKIEELRKKTISAFREIPGMLGLARQLKNNGYYIGIISNNVVEWADAFNEKFSPKSIFSTIIMSFEEGAAKPDERIYRIFLEKSGLKPEECVFIDDKKRNLEPAERMGFKAIHFESREKLENELEKMGLNKKREDA